MQGWSRVRAPVVYRRYRRAVTTTLNRDRRTEPVQLEHSNVTVLHCHPLADCWTPNLPCPAHGRTDHPMREWPQTWDALLGFGRVCEHGVIHPDPDDLTFVVHDGCCGCCDLLD